MLSPGALAHRPLKKRLFLAWAQHAPRFSGVRWHATSEQEAEDIHRHFGHARIDVAPNLAGPPPPPPPPRPAPPWRVVSLGRVHPVKNLVFACEVLAGLGRPVLWDVVGPWEDPAEVARLEAAARVAGEAAAGNAGEAAIEVRFHGALEPAAAAAVLREAHFLMMPSVTENYGHAVVEAWAAGCPVWVSDGTPWRGLREAGVGEVLPLDVEVWRGAVRGWMDAGPEAWAAASARCAAYRADLDERSGAAEATRRIFSP
jgi:glycosyltransferase involved in cell wall biosynthesis